VEQGFPGENSDESAQSADNLAERERERERERGGGGEREKEGEHASAQREMSQRSEES